MRNINEEHKDLKNKNYRIDGEDYTYTNLTSRISELKKKQEAGTISDDESKKLKKLEDKYEAEKDRDDSVKRSKMNSGMENSFKKEHTKNRDNSNNVTKPGGLAKVTSSGKHSKVSDQINDNRVQYYESIDSEIDAMRYLIEYMDNNNKNKII